MEKNWSGFGYVFTGGQFRSCRWSFVWSHCWLIRDGSGRLRFIRQRNLGSTLFITKQKKAFSKKCWKWWCISACWRSAGKERSNIFPLHHPESSGYTGFRPSGSVRSRKGSSKGHEAGINVHGAENMLYPETVCFRIAAGIEWIFQTAQEWGKYEKQRVCGREKIVHSLVPGKLRFAEKRSGMVTRLFAFQWPVAWKSPFCGSCPQPAQIHDYLILLQ